MYSSMKQMSDMIRQLSKQMERVAEYEHTNGGKITIPNMALKPCMASSARAIADKITGLNPGLTYNKIEYLTDLANQNYIISISITFYHQRPFD